MKKFFNKKNLNRIVLSFSKKRRSINWSKGPIIRFIEDPSDDTLIKTVNIQSFIKEMKMKSQSNDFNHHFFTTLFQELKLYRSFRQSFGFPSNGQRTKTNAKTSKQMLHYIQLLQKYINS